MSTYVITGVSKGIGFELLKQISENPKNTVVGLVRDKAATEKKIAEKLGERSNVHILHADLGNYATLKQAAADTAPIVGDRGVEYLIANAGYASQFDAYDPIGVLGEKHEELDHVAKELWSTNVVGDIHLFNLFMPLVLKGSVKKVIAISSGHADLELINKFDLENSALYAASKAALNVIVGKFSAQYKKDGVLFLSLSPGVVEVGHFDNMTPAQMKGAQKFMGTVMAYNPDFKGPTPVEEAIPKIIAAWEHASIEKGNGGAFISHLAHEGNTLWV